MTRTCTVEEGHLEDIRALIQERSGIQFDTSRGRFFSTRVLDHIQAKGLASGSDLIPLLTASNIEYEALLQRLLTHETSFFRYPAAFKGLEKRVLPEVYSKRIWVGPRALRIWSAGCSTGEEAYSIAISVAGKSSFAAGWVVEILGTDISRQAIARASQGVYSPRSMANLTPEQIETYFNPLGEQFEVKPSIRNRVSFVVMNLVQCPYLGRMDCIFCMNVLIYFSEARREQLIRSFYDSLEPGGYLLLGHSESLGNIPVKFEKIVFEDFLLYRKPSGENGNSKTGSQM